MTILHTMADPAAATKIQRSMELAERDNAAMCRAIDAAFYSAVRMLRAQGYTEPTTYYKALEALNTAVKPYNVACAP